MGNRFWIVACVLAAGLVFWGIGYFVSPNSGDTEFQKALEATQQVKSFRGTQVAGASSNQHGARLWEVDCYRGILHKQSSEQVNGTDAPEVTEDEFLVGYDRYARGKDGFWEKTGDTHQIYSAKWYCENLAKGTLRDLLPDFRAMLRNALIGKGDKKVVNGVRCQEWRYAMKSRYSGAQGSIYLGLQDHLPYQMTIDGGDQYSYSDYNRPNPFEAPEAVVQEASSTEGSN